MKNIFKITKEKLIKILTNLVAVLSLLLIFSIGIDMEWFVGDFNVLRYLATADVIFMLILATALFFTTKDTTSEELIKHNAELDKLEDAIHLDYYSDRSILYYIVTSSLVNLYNGKEITTIIYKQGGGVKLYYGNTANEIMEQIDKDYDDGLLTPTQKEEVKPKK